MAPTGQLRQPRAWLVAGGHTIVIRGFECNLTRRAEASTAEVFMALDDPTNPGPMFWSQGGQISASLVATNGDGADTTGTLLVGYVEVADVDFGTRSVKAHLVDMTRPLLDNRTDANWTNTQTSQIVQQLAAQNGLNCVADPGSMAGRTFNDQDYACLSDLQSHWDLIQELARQDGYVAFVNGNTLYYVDPGNVVGSTYSILYTPPSQGTYETSNAVKLRCRHNFNIGQGVQGGVDSYNTYDNQPYSASSGSGSLQSTSRQPGLTSDQTKTAAQRNTRELEMHEYDIDVTMRGDVTVQPTMMLSLSGTQSAFDMTYYIIDVEHHMNDDDGYTMTISGSNSPPFDAGYSPGDSTAETLGQGTDPNPPVPQQGYPAFDYDTGTGGI